jgi:heme oxygenase
MSTTLLSAEQLASARELSARLARDPAFMRSIEQMLEQHGAELERLVPESLQLVTSGWSERDLAAMPSPKAAAAAVGAAVAAMAAGPGAAAVVATA